MSPVYNETHRWAWLLGVGAAVILVDQLTKWWAVEGLEGGEIVQLVWTLQLRLVRNDGAAFSLASGLTPLITIAAIAISVALVVAARKISRPSVLVAMGLILGGALGNVIDRFFRPGDGFMRGHVIDFFDLQWWPVFNIADMAIVIGGFLLVMLLTDKGGEPEAESASGKIVGDDGPERRG
ncbi:MAG: signal peptidase II [Acidimicrobiales bacterium]